MEHFEGLGYVGPKPAKWLGYIDDTLMVWPHVPMRLQKFLHHLKCVRPTMKFAMEVEALPFLDVLVMKRGPKLAVKVYRKPTHIPCGKFRHIGNRFNVSTIF
jgi:hypothetical protein